MTRLQHRAKTSPWLPFSEIDPIEILVESLLNSLGALEFRFCLLNARSAQEPFSNIAVSSSAAFSCFSPATENTAANLSNSGGRGSLPVAMSTIPVPAPVRPGKRPFSLSHKQSSFRRVFGRFGLRRVVAEWQPKNSSMHFTSVSNVSLANAAVTRPKKKVPETSGDHITLSRSPPNTGQPEFFRIIS